MLTVGLTGGIGSGKSEVARRLVARGAVLIDADVLAREVVEPGAPGLAAVLAEFGSEVLGPDGSLDRSTLAARVFTHAAARDRLNAIVHPLVRARTAELTAAAPPDAIVVNDVPLLVETGLARSYDVVVVVEAPLSQRLARLAERGLSEPDARRRMDAQATDDERRAVADVVVDNAGGLAALDAAVDQLWQRLVGRSRSGRPSGGG